MTSFLEDGRAKKKRKFLPDPERLYPFGYEQGTYTVQLQDTSGDPATTNEQEGVWIRMGNLVWVNMNVRCTGLGSVIATQTIKVTLPFPVSTTTANASGVIGYITRIIATRMGDHIALRADSGNAFAYIVASNETTDGFSLNFNDIRDGGVDTRLRATICYKIDSVAYP